MSKYIVEGGFDFFSELYESLDNINDNDDDSNKCLITGLDLEDKYVTLYCGHKFNYIPLHHDIVNHKLKFNILESSKSKLKSNEIRCPYCRNVQTELLPYYPELGLTKVNGVHFIDFSDESLNHECHFVYLNASFDNTMPESDTNKKYLNKCKNMNATTIKVFNNTCQLNPINFGDNKPYCCMHKKEMIKYYKHLEKVKATEEKKKAKQLAKQLALEEKKAKQTTKGQQTIATGENITIGEMGCLQTLKTGPNKGNQCGCKIFANNLCKRHTPKTN